MVIDLVHDAAGEELAMALAPWPRHYSILATTYCKVISAQTYLVTVERGLSSNACEEHFQGPSRNASGLRATWCGEQKPTCGVPTPYLTGVRAPWDPV